MLPKLSVCLGKLKLANPVLVASGTFGYGEDYQDLFPLKKLGGIITKTVTLKPQAGNRPPRIAETDQGLLNSIGLENPGLEAFIKEKLPYLEKSGIPIIVSIAGESAQQFGQIARRLSRISSIAALELNLSCPNIGKKGLIAQDATLTYAVVKATRRATKLPLISKLSPNVTDIALIAQAAKKAGSDVLSLVNTFLALAVDANTKTAKLGNVTGGLSGPAIKPQALWMLRRAFCALNTKKAGPLRKLNIPIIGMGGISNAQDALEFIICGASAIAVGTANFINPLAAIEIIAGIKQYLQEHKIKDIKQLIGSLSA